MVLVGVAGSLSLAFIAGARRSSSVVARFFAAAPRYDASVFGPSLDRPMVLSLPGVRRADPSGYVALDVVDSNAAAIGVDGYTMDFDAPVDAPLRVLQGTMPHRADETKIVVDPVFARRFDAAVGDSITVQMYAPDQNVSVSVGDYQPSGPTYRVTIAAIIRPPSEIAIDEPHTSTSRFGSGGLWFSDQFWEHHHSEFLDYGQQFFLRLANGQDGIQAVAAALPPPATADEQPPVVVPDERFSRRGSYDTPVALETTALLALGIGVAIAAAATLMLLLRTEQRFHDRDEVGLRTLGFTSTQLALVAALRALPAAVLGAVAAMAGAIALSGRFPIGIGRELEQDIGLQVNLAVVLIGGVLTMVLVFGCSVVASRSRVRKTSVTPSRFTIPRWLRRTGAPTELTLGAHLAFESPRGHRSITTAQGIVGCVAALVVVGAVGMWVGGVDRLYNTPARHGWPWDAAVGNTNFPLQPETAARLADDPLLAGLTKAVFGQAALDGTSTELFAFDAAGTAPPVIVDGRLPTGPSEIAIGTRTLRRLGVSIGGTVTMSLVDSEFNAGPSAPDVQLTVVGTALAPMFGESDLGDPSVVTLDAIRAGGGDATPRFVMARFAGPDHTAISARLDSEFTEDQLLDIIPARVVNMHRVRSVPVIGIGLAAVLTAITLAYVIVAGARSHRRDLAVLRAIGLGPNHVRRVLMWQATLTALISVTVGLPIAIVAGSTMWQRVANGTGVQRDPAIPSAIALTVPIALVVALGSSMLVYGRLRRSRVADLLHQE